MEVSARHVKGELMKTGLWGLTEHKIPKDKWKDGIEGCTAVQHNVKLVIYKGKSR